MKVKETGKKVAEFVFMKKALNQRNITSIGLVIIFFIVYVMAGGKIDFPSVKQGENFGSISNSQREIRPRQRVSEKQFEEPVLVESVQVPVERKDKARYGNVRSRDTRRPQNTSNNLNDLESRLQALEKRRRR